MTDLAVLVALRGDLEPEVVRILSRTPGLQVTRRCADLAELLGAAEAGLGDVAVISADLPMLDRTTIASLRTAGVVTLALVDPAEPWQRERMLALGVTAFVDMPGQDLPAAITTWAGSEAPVSPEPEPVVDDDFEGRVIAVWGPTGAPGRTTVAVNLAAVLAERGQRVLLVDADTYGASVAQVLGMLTESSGIAAAMRAVGTGQFDAATLIRLAPAITENLRVLTGIPRPDRWPELHRYALDELWPVARSAADFTVVDTGFGIEIDEDLSYDTRAPQRNAATLSALQAADEAVIVGGGDVVGLARVIRALGEETVRTLLPALRRIVINRVHQLSGGSAQVTEALNRYANVPVDILIPWDPAVITAQFRGEPLVGAASDSPAGRAIEHLADLVDPMSAVGRRARRGKPGRRLRRGSSDGAA